MKQLRILPSLIPALLLTVAAPQMARAAYPLTEDSKVQPGVPKGEVLHFTFEKSKIYPGTFRDYWIYVPAQYTPDKPACLFVNQDGVGWNAPTVFDNLIAKKEMPVTIGVFVQHGRVRAANGATALDRFNRSLEYDGLGDAYARFLIEELLPDVETKKATDGRAIRISHDGKDCAIGGGSSGAIAAFTAAWERPDRFSRVFSAIGTYVSLRGGDEYPGVIRKVEPKPLRVFLQDGSADQNIYGGDWWMANQMMERALTFAGYEVDHAWGDGGHNGEQGSAVFPDAMRFLWKGWPAAPKAGKSRNTFLNDILVNGEDWKLVADGYRWTLGAAANKFGDVLFADGATGSTYRIGSDGKAIMLPAGAKKPVGQAFGPDGRLYSATMDGKVVAQDADGKETVLAKDVHAADLVVANNGNLYAVQPGGGGSDPSKVWLIQPGKAKKLVDTGLAAAHSLTLSPDQTLLYVSEARTHWIYSYQVQPDGTLLHKQQYYWLHLPDAADESAAGGMCVDRDGRLYVATNMGVQVCDQAGRVNCILPLPNGKVSSVAFGGANGDTLFATCGDKVYRRKLAIKGTHAWEAPNKPAGPRL